MTKRTKSIVMAGALIFSIFGIMASLATAGISSFGAAYAQQTGSNATTAAPSNQTSTSSSTTSGNQTLSGIITSTQLNNAGAPEWLTAGSWTLVTDKPVFGGDNQTKPQVKSFEAVLVMTSLANGTKTHSHHISDFKQISAIQSGGNSTLFNGTMTVTTELGTTQNVPGFLDFQNDRMSIWVSPGNINNHFGPTPINGIIPNPQLLQEIRSMESQALQQQAGATTTQSGNSSAGAIGNLTLSNNQTTLR